MNDEHRCGNCEFYGHGICHKIGEYSKQPMGAIGAKGGSQCPHFRLILRSGYCSGCIQPICDHKGKVYEKDVCNGQCRWKMIKIPDIRLRRCLACEATWNATTDGDECPECKKKEPIRIKAQWYFDHILKPWKNNLLQDDCVVAHIANAILGAHILPKPAHLPKKCGTSCSLNGPDGCGGSCTWWTAPKPQPPKDEIPDMKPAPPTCSTCGHWSKCWALCENDRPCCWWKPSEPKVQDRVQREAEDLVTRLGCTNGWTDSRETAAGIAAFAHRERAEVLRELLNMVSTNLRAEIAARVSIEGRLAEEKK